MPIVYQIDASATSRSGSRRVPAGTRVVTYSLRKLAIDLFDDVFDLLALRVVDRKNDSARTGRAALHEAPTRFQALLLCRTVLGNRVARRLFLQILIAHWS
jgi:hypothetical protein